MRLIRLQALCNSLGFQKSTAYELIKQGLLPPPARRGSRDAVWASHEADALASAYLRGFTDEQTRQLCEALVLARHDQTLLRAAPIADLIGGGAL